MTLQFTHFKFLTFPVAGDETDELWKVEIKPAGQQFKCRCISFCKRRDDIISWDIFLKTDSRDVWTDGNITQTRSTAAPTWQPEWIAVKLLIILKANLRCRAGRVQTQSKIYCHYIFWSVCLAWFERHHVGVSSHEVRNILSVIQLIDTYGLIEMIRVMLKALRTAEVILTLILSLLCSSESRQCERTTPGPWNQRGWIE